MAKTGILGGTFDPIHSGHVLCALKIKEEFGLDRVLILPSGNPPHRFACRVTPGAVRQKLCEIAVSGLEGISVCDAEVKKNGYTYTADTLAELKDEYSGDSLYYIIGDDAAAGIGNWKNADVLKDYCAFIVVKRAGGSGSTEEAVKALKDIGAHALLSKESLPEISSTDIRKAFSEGGLPKEGAVPENVAKYISEHDLYGQRPVTEEMMIEDLRSVLPPKRFIHSLGVAEEAVRLAEKFGADKDRARLAGLLHDCAKGVTIPQLRWINMTADDFSQSPADGFSYRILHGPLGAIVAERRYGVTDRQVLSAISKHTTGDREMSLLDKIVFIADYTEKNRCGGFFDEVRNLADTEGLTAAIAFACDETIKVILKRGEPIDVRTIYTRNAALAGMADKKN